MKLLIQIQQDKSSVLFKLPHVVDIHIFFRRSFISFYFAVHMGVWAKLGKHPILVMRFTDDQPQLSKKMYVFSKLRPQLRAWMSPQNLGSKKLMASTLCRKVIATLEFHAGQSDISVRFSVVVHWTIYSATTILGKCRKVVPEKWFCKLGFFSGQALFSNQIS